MSVVIQLLAKEFDVTEAMIHQIVRSAPHRYKVFQIPKKSGRGMRTIAQPAREVKALQRIVVEKILNDLPIHEASTAYVKGSSIRANAATHAENRYLLKMDFESFFPSIKPLDLRNHINRFLPDKFDEDDLAALCSIIFWKRRGSTELELCIGGPSSPFISNTVVYDFDEEVTAFSRERGVRYTRYADDLAFSTDQPNVLSAVENFVQQCVERQEYPRLSINFEKTIRTSKKHLRRVTGLVLSSEGKVSLGRNRKRQIRAMLHRILVSGGAEQDIEYVKGMLAFANDAEPEFVSSMRQKYGDDLVERVLRWRPD